MPSRLWLTILLLSAPGLHAPRLYAQGPATASPSAVYKLEGSVINAQTGRPVAHALVEMYGPKKLAVLTGDEGQFAFDNIPKGNFALSARKPGFFVPGTAGYNVPMTTAEVGPQARKVELKLMPEGVISGQVTSDDGEPLEGASVEALAVIFVQGRRELRPVNSNVRTDEDGNFRLGGLSSGRYYVAVKAGPAARRILGAQTKDRAESYPGLVYYPYTEDIAAASLIQLAGGQRMQVSLSLKRVPAFKLGGVISGIAGYKMVNPPMIMEEAGGNSLFNVNRWESQTGTFEFPPIPAGTYTLMLTAQDAENNFSWQKQSITIDHDRTDLALHLQPGVTIPVIIHTELNSNVSGQGSGYSGPREGLYAYHSIQANVILEKADSPTMQLSARTEGDKDSLAQVFHSVMPGKYRVRVMPMVDAYISSIRSGGVDLLREDLVVPDGGNVAPIEVLLRDGGGSVRVHVQSDSPAAQGRIFLLPEFAPSLAPVDLDIGESGEREYGNLAPGEYKVLAFDSVNDLEYGNREVLEKYSSKGGRVTVAAHTTSNVTVELIHIGDVD
jgi:Carboxypeptidase regulatory-like domain